VERQINTQAVWDFLTYRYVPGPETIWHGVRKLSPGAALQLPDGRPPVEVPYWTTEVMGPDGHATHRLTEKRRQEFTSLFLDAVQLRLTASDVPVGVLLSGGLDSSAIAAAAVELGHRDFHTFSVGFDEGGYYSELPYARQVASQVGARHHEIIINQKQFLDMLPELVFYSDEPVADLAAIPTLAVCRLARQHVKVVLSGEGSDEVLGGYDLDRAERQWATVRALQRIPSIPLAAGVRWSSRLLSEHHQRAARRVAQVPLPEWNRRDLPHITRVFSQSEKERLWPSARGEESTRILQSQYAQSCATDPLQQLLSVYQKSWLVEDLLMKADKMSMAASLELREPFLDYRLVEWANRQPNWVKVRRTRLLQYETKSILRRFCAGRLPQEILDRPKRGFPVPAYRWLQHGLDGWAASILLGKDSRVAEVFETDLVPELLRLARSGDQQAAAKVWLLIVLEFWMKEWRTRFA
jgi:asparagine synthase (glutamine-hydrolysing)